MKKLSLAVSLFVGLLWAVPAQADLLGFAGTGQGSVVTVGGSYYTGSVFAGELNWNWVGVPPQGLAQSLTTFCVDLLNFVRNPQDVTVESTNAMNTPTNGAGARAAWLVNTFGGSGLTGYQAAGLQVAIWETIYDYASHSLSSGNFYVAANSQVLSYANTYLTALGTSTSEAIWLKTTQTPNGGQSQILRSVPEPATMTLLMVGLGLGGVLRRRVTSRPPQND